MARKRMIDPHIWEDPGFNSLSRDARLLYIGMISNADDEGYIRADIGSLKRLIFGFDEVTKEQVTNWQEEIMNLTNLHFFELNDEWYAHFVKWNIYQKQREDRMQTSSYPKCDKCQSSDGHLPAEVKLSKEKLSKGNIKNIDKTEVGTSANLKELVQDLDKDVHIRNEYQALGLELWSQLGAPKEKKSEFIRIMRDYPRDKVDSAYSFARDYPVTAIRYKMFFKQLYQLMKPKHE